MIVKVQLSIMTSEPKRRMIVYNEDRSINYEADVPVDVLNLMFGEAKAFFHAHMDGTEIVLDEKAEWQEW